MSVYDIQLIDKRGKLKEHPTKKYGTRTSWNKVIVHHSLTKTGSSEAFARYHVETNTWPGIGYHYVITQDGIIDWCNNHNIKCYHAGNHNSYTIGVCLIGNFLVQQLPNIQKVALFWLLKNILKVSDTDILGHNELKEYEWKNCPCISMSDIRREYGEFCKESI